MAVDVRVPVDTKNTFRLGDLIDPAKLSRDAMGVVVAVESVYGRNHHYVTTRGAANPADIRLYALAPDIEAPKEQRVKSASAWAREAFPLPREFRSAPIAIPASGARLSFGVGFEDILEQLGVRTLTDAIDGDGRRTFAVRARILVEVGGAPQEIFSQEFRFELYKTNKNYFVVAGLEGPLKYSAKTFYDRADSPLHTFVNATGQPLAAGELALLETLDPLDQSPPNIEELFFDLSADPGEHSPLAPSPAMRALRRALLDDLRKSSEEARQRLEATGLPSELTDTEREQLRSLGYVD